MLSLVSAIALARIVSVLDSEPRLDKPITIRCEANTVRSVVNDISESTGVALNVQPTIADDGLVLYCERQPARRVLEMLSNHFDWTWELDRGTFKLTQTTKQMRLEEEATKNQILSTYRPIRERALTALKERPLPSDETDLEKALAKTTQLAETYRSGYLSSDRRTQAKWISENDANEALKQKLTRRLSPGYRLCDWIIANLTDADLMDLDTSSRLVFSYNPTAWQKGFPPNRKFFLKKLFSGMPRNPFSLYRWIQLDPPILLGGLDPTM